VEITDKGNARLLRAEGHSQSEFAGRLQGETLLRKHVRLLCTSSRKQKASRITKEHRVG
jgi:hypothetical protein